MERVFPTDGGFQLGAYEGNQTYAYTDYIKAAIAYSLLQPSFAKNPQPPQKRLIPSCPPPHEQAFHQVRPASRPHAPAHASVHTEARTSVPQYQSRVRASLPSAHHTFPPKRGLPSSRPARDFSVSTASPKLRAMPAQAVHRLQPRPQPTC